MIYGEISDEGRFRFISAGHPRPMVFSREFGRFVRISEEQMVSFPPVGMFPSKVLNERVDPGKLGFKQPYTVNEIDLLAGGDVLLLYTDGLSEHAGGTYFPKRVEALLAAAGNASAEVVCNRIREDLLAFAPPQDDISFVVIRKT
jgi:serine/threonine protein phosphatase PrpC